MRWQATRVLRWHPTSRPSARWDCRGFLTRAGEGLFAPKGTPKDIIGTLNAAVVEALADPVVQSRLVDLGVVIFPRDQQTPEALGARVKADAEKWGPRIKGFGI